jgi:hypothetical protein
MLWQVWPDDVRRGEPKTHHLGCSQTLKDSKSFYDHLEKSLS